MAASPSLGIRDASEPGAAVRRRAKLSPPRVPSDAIRRSALERRLERAAELPLTLVVARAGFGKTVLLAEWAHATAHPIAWLSLDPADSDLVRFVRGLVGAVRATLPDAVPQAAALVAPGEPVDPVVLTEALSDDLFDLPHDLVLVLDDLDAACWSGPADLLSAILRFPPPRLRVVATCRREPEALNVARLRGLGLVETIGEADLRFGPEEIALAFGGGPNVPVDRVLARTGGWPAGVRALARDGADAPCPASVRACIENAMLDGLPAGTAAFLRRIAVAERVTPALAAELAGDDVDEAAAADRLAAAARGALLDREGGGPWWTLNPLLREHLAAELRDAEGEAAVRILHGRAARWLAAAGEDIAAVDQSLLAGESALAAELIEANILDWLSGTREAALEWIARLPNDVVATSAPLLVARAAMQVLSCNPAQATASLQAAERLLDMDMDVDVDTDMDMDMAPSGARRPALAGPVAEALRWEIVHLWTGVSLMGGEARVSLDDIRAVIEGPPGVSLFARGIGPGMWGLEMQVAGRWEEARPVLEAQAASPDAAHPVFAYEATWPVAALHLRNADIPAFLPWLDRAARLGRPGSASRRLQWLASLQTAWLLETGDLDGTVATGEAALRDAPGIAAFPRNEVLLRMGRALLALGRIGEARHVAADARRWLDRAGAVQLLPTVAALDAEIALASGSLAAAWRWADTTQAAFTPDPLRQTDHVAEAQARIWLARNRPGDAAAAVASLERLRDLELATRDRLGLARTLPLLAVAHAQAGDPDAARTAMREALTVERGALTRRFTSLGGPASALLAEIATGGGDLAPRAARLLAAWPEPPGAPAAAPTPALPVAPNGSSVRLTPRQQAILDRMARWLTDKEIAAELGLSVYTVNEHVGNIMRKLDVGDRRSAVAAAAAAGLVARPDGAPFAGK